MNTKTAPSLSLVKDPADRIKLFYPHTKNFGVGVYQLLRW